MANLGLDRDREIVWLQRTQSLRQDIALEDEMVGESGSIEVF